MGYRGRYPSPLFIVLKETRSETAGEDMAFTLAVLCQAGLPRAKIEAREFMRQSRAA